MHGHKHSHGPGHAHGHAQARGNERATFWVALLTGAFMVVEVVGGVLSGSLALLADAGHMLADVAALGLAWFAFRLERRPADSARTYGFNRFQVLVAFANGLTLVFIAGWIVLEAAHRLGDPAPVLGGPMLAVAAAGLAVNIVAFAVLHAGADRENLNIRGAMLHVLGDMLGSVAAMAAAAVILATGWTPIDPILSVFVALLILRGAWGLITESAHILIEGAPREVDVAAIAPDLAEAIPEVEEVHHVHAWSLSQARTVATLHARVARGADPTATVAAIKARLSERFGIGHATVEIELEDCADERADPC